jgi:hypothetical protein
VLHVFSCNCPLKRFVCGFAAVEPMHVLSLKGAAAGQGERVKGSRTLQIHPHFRYGW